MKRVWVVCLLAISGLAMTASPCWACSCAGGVSKEEQADAADAVFYGKVVHLDYPEQDDGVSGGGNVKVRIWVKTVYKGKDVARVTTVRTSVQGSACGYGFEKGERYTVFADKNNGRYSTHSCSGTKSGNINPENYGLPEGSEPED